MILAEPIENGIEGGKRRQQEFFELVEGFRSETDPEAAKRLGGTGTNGLRPSERCPP
jgi:hypothetical protein